MNVLALITDAEHLWLVAGPLAVFADQLHVSQKLHFNRNRAVALAGFTASTWYVEREVPGVETALLRLRQRSKQVADGVKRFDIRDGVGSWCPPDGRLIHQHHFIHPLRAVQIG